MSSEPTARQRIVVLSGDLMDRSRFEGAWPEATHDVIFVDSPARLSQEAASAALAIVDLRRLPHPAMLATINADVVAFGSHVDDAALAAAADAGAEALPRSVFFRRLAEGGIGN